MSGFAALLIVGWAAWRRKWRDLGYVRPRSWPLSIAAAIIGGAAFKFAMKALVMPLLGANPINRTYHFLAGNRAMIPAMIFTIIFTAGFGEETLFRSYFFERLGKLFGSSVAAKIAIVLLTSALFAAAHYHDQGIDGTEQAAIVGLVFGTIFAITRSIFPLMIAHTSFDLTAYAMIYWNLETRIAHLIFH